jgi:phosphatidylglycerol:prolipoprotein diacylglycerol transferase
MNLSFLFIRWNVHPDIPLPFDWFSIQWYGLMWSLSIISCFFVGRWILKKENLSDDHLVLIVQYIFIGAIVGARLGQVFFYQWEYFSQNLLDIFKIWNGGLASHGGLVGGLVGLLLFVKRYPQYKLLWLIDRASLVILIPAALIRLGNLFNSELYGKVSDVPWAFIFELVDNSPRHPVVLYEAIGYFILFLGSLALYRKYQSRFVSLYAAYFFTLTFTLRFFLEFTKEPESNLFLGVISKTQILSLPFIAFGLILFIYSLKKKES